MVSHFSGPIDFRTNRFCSSFIRGDAARMSSGVPKRINSITSRSVSEVEEFAERLVQLRQRPAISFGRSETIT